MALEPDGGLARSEGPGIPALAVGLRASAIGPPSLGFRGILQSWRGEVRHWNLEAFFCC